MGHTTCEGLEEESIVHWAIRWLRV